MFDTYAENEMKMMFENNVIAAWGSAKRYLDAFQRGDYVFYYKSGAGVIAVGTIADGTPMEIEDDGKQLPVAMIVSAKQLENGQWVAIPASEIHEKLGHQFFYASTRKVPFLTAEECQTLITALKDTQPSP